MPARFAKLVHWFDALILISALVATLLVPIFFMVPYNDEWLRLNTVTERTVWDWTVYHSQTWVVRPTAELIMGFVSWMNTREALGADFNAHNFLVRFHTMYVWLEVALLGLLYVLAAVLSESWRALHALACLCGALLICIAVSDELGFAFYWCDGYANVVLPFFVMSIGLLLFLRTNAWAILGAVLLLTAAMAHEILCIFSFGFAALALFGRRSQRPQKLLYGVFLLACVAILWAQGFSAGPAIRSEVYLRNTGVRYNWAGVWAGIRSIDPWRSALGFAGMLALIAVAGERLRVPVQRALRDLRQNPLFWYPLPVGAALTCLLPLGTVGLKKPTIIVGAYSVATELFVLLSAALAYPLLAAALSRWTGRYRERVGSLVVVLLLVVPFSKNLASYRSAVHDFDALRGQAKAYIDTLFSGKPNVRVTRPCHPFIKPGSGMSARNSAQYLGLQKVKEKACPR
jgi:hypothetical protein